MSDFMHGGIMGIVLDITLMYCVYFDHSTAIKCIICDVIAFVVKTLVIRGINIIILHVP